MAACKANLDPYFNLNVLENRCKPQIHALHESKIQLDAAASNGGDWLARENTSVTLSFILILTYAVIMS